MKKKNLLIVVASIVFATANALTAMAQEVAGISQTSTLPITRIVEETDGNYNFKSFEVEVLESGSYYTEFWLLPSKYANNRFSTFMVYVNEEYIGSISPTVGNWQSARVRGHETFYLTKGKNVITIATLAPEFPEVETLKASMSDADATFSSEAYEEYLDEAAIGITYDIPEENEITICASDATGVTPAHFSNVPLNYTFYKTFNFTQNQEIFITSSSSSLHKIDVVYYASTREYIVNPDIVTPKDTIYPIVPNIANSIRFNSIDVDLGNFPPIKDLCLYTPATSEEMQGLSWVFPSEKALNSSTQIATARLTIPKSGQYLVRVRHAETGGTSVADINVNGAYYYENMPITLSYHSCEIPADGNAYATFTCCNNFGKDDPYLFIHGADCDKIVGFNDDAPREKKKQYNLSFLDSYISQTYFMKTLGVSVSNYSSSNPKSRCSIFTRISEESAQSVAKVRTKRTNTTDVSGTPTIDASVRIIAPDNINGSFSINASVEIQQIYVYALTGNCIGSAYCKESCVSIPASTFNVTQSGVYVVSVETINGVYSQKCIIK